MNNKINISNSDQLDDPLENQLIKSNNSEIELDLVEVIKVLINEKHRILIISFIVTIIGLIITIFTPKLYTSTVKLLPEFSNNSGNFGRFSGFAAQFGLGSSGSNSGSETLSPILYNEILMSTDFLIRVVNKNVYLNEINDSLSIKDFYQNHNKSNPVIKYTIGLPSHVLGLFRSNKESVQIAESNAFSNLITIPNEYNSAVIQLRNSIALYRDLETGLISIAFTTQDPYISYQIGEILVNGLETYLIDFRTKKARQDLEFINDRYFDAKEEFELQQYLLSEFRDMNQGVLSATARNREQYLISTYNIAYNVLNNLAEQLVQTKIQVQSETPVMNVLESNYVNTIPTSPNVKRQIFIFAFLGFAIAISVVLFRPLFSSSRN